MVDDSVVKFWPLIHSLIGEFWKITGPRIENAAIRYEIPIELYSYSELGLESFSRDEFQKRDPFSNPQLFEKVFVILNVKGWIQPRQDGSYQVSEKARQGARQIIQSGDEQLLPLETSSSLTLRRLAILLKQIVMASTEAPPPPEQWAITHRFRVAEKDSPWIVQVREYLMDLLAYRDDCHLAASHPHFGQAGIVWSVLGALWRGERFTAEQMAESHSFRGYETDDYEVALQAVTQIGWAKETRVPDVYSITPQGREIFESAQHLTDEYFYIPWSVLTRDELAELYDLLLKLHEQLNAIR